MRLQERNVYSDESCVFLLRAKTPANQLFKRAFLRKRFSEASAASAGEPGCVSPRKNLTRSLQSTQSFKDFFALFAFFAAKYFLWRTSSATRKRYRLRRRVSAGRWTRRRQAAALPDASVTLAFVANSYFFKYSWASLPSSLTSTGATPSSGADVSSVLSVSALM